MKQRKARILLWHPRCPTCGTVEDEPLLVLPPHVDFRAPGDIGPWEKQKRRKQRQTSHGLRQAFNQEARMQNALWAQQQHMRSPFGMSFDEAAQQGKGQSAGLSRWPIGWPFS